MNQLLNQLHGEPVFDAEQRAVIGTKYTVVLPADGNGQTDEQRLRDLLKPPTPVDGKRAYQLVIVPQDDPTDPDGLNRLRGFLRTGLRSWRMRTIEVEPIATNAGDARRSDGDEKGDEAVPTLAIPTTNVERVQNAQRLDSGLTATQESRLAAMVARAKAKEAKAAKRA